VGSTTNVCHPNSQEDGIEISIMSVACRESSEAPSRLKVNSRVRSQKQTFPLKSHLWLLLDSICQLSPHPRQIKVFLRHAKQLEVHGCCFRLSLFLFGYLKEGKAVKAALTLLKPSSSVQ
jgi:hypothetical protein